MFICYKHFNTYSREISPFFQQNILRPLTGRDKTILLLASLALGFLATCYLIKRCYFKAVSLEEPSDKKKADPTLPNDSDNEINENSQHDDSYFQQQVNQAREMSYGKAQLSQFEQEKVQKFKSDLEKLIDKIRECDSDIVPDKQENKSYGVLRRERQIASLEEAIAKETDPDALKNLNSALERTKESLISSRERADLEQKQYKERFPTFVFTSLEDLVKLHLALRTSKESIYNTLQPYFAQYPEINDIALKCC